MGNYIFSAFVGALIGSIGTYLYMKKKQEEAVKEAVDEYRVMVKENADKWLKSDSNTSENKSTPSIKEKMEDVKILRKTINQQSYNTMYHDEEKPAEESRVSKRRPYAILEDVVGNNGYDIEFLTYYAKEDIIVNSDGSQMEHDEIEQVLGVDLLREFVDDPAMPEIGYIRNDTLGLDYEIDIERNGTYVEA